MRYQFLIVLLVLFLFPTSEGRAQVRLPRLVRDSMVLQRETPVNIWGWASPREKIKIHFQNKVYPTRADAKGNWSLLLPAMKAGGPYTMKITASNQIELKDIWMGDVWFCSGQSNMVHQLDIHDVRYADEIKQANDPLIRQFLVPVNPSLSGPVENINNGFWQPAIGEKVRTFSAVAYFFAKRLFDKYQIPIGIINASVGGTPIEAWTSEDGLTTFPALLNTIAKNKDTAYINALNRRAEASNKSSVVSDKGLTESPKWYETDYQPNPSAWRTINVPGYWEDQGIKDLNGVVWYRREIDIPGSMAGKPAKAFLGRIVDADVLYINGVKVGNTTYQYPQRRYEIPSGVLKQGKNTFVIQVTNQNGKGGFVSVKPYCIFSGNDTVDLKGYWRYKVGDVFVPGKKDQNGGGISAQNQPAALFNGMVSPVIPYTIKGIAWYQGESNTARPQDYAPYLKGLIADWRQKWNADSLPFLIIQLPGFMDYNYLPSESNWALLREAQSKALSIPKTAMVVAIDLGEWNDVHPDRKKEVGERLALAAAKTAYQESIVFSGPVFESAKSEGNKIRINFTQTGSGLTTNDGEPLSEFAIAGKDKKFVWAKATIQGNSILVENDTIINPVYVRYAWADNPVNPNLYNKEGLPASPFRTDKD